MRTSRTNRLLAMVPLCAALGCSEPVQVGATPNVTPPATPAAPAPVAPGAPPEAAAGATEVADAGVDGAARTYRDEDFVEQDVINRDPFRDFVLSIPAQALAQSPRQVKMRNVSLDQMRLIAIITGIPVPYAMIQDPEGIGHVVVRGDYIGRDEVVNAGGADGMPIALNWRIDRIREGELILTREDPLHPDQPPLMRSMAIRDASMESQGVTGLQQGQLTNTGETTSPAAAGPSPGGAFAAPAPAPTPRRQSGGSTLEPSPAPSPAPSTTYESPSGGGTTQTGTSSRFGGVFNRR